VKNSLRLGVVTAAVLTLGVLNMPAHALMGSGTNGCPPMDGAVASPWTAGPPHSMRACVGVDNAIQATGEVLNNSSSSNYNVWTKLHRSSDGAVIASHNCQAIVPAGETYYCTKSWPKSNTTVYSSFTVQRGSGSSTVVYSPHKTVTV